LHELVGVSYLGSLQEGAVKHIAGKLKEGVEPRRLLAGLVPDALLSLLSPAEWRELIARAVANQEVAQIEKPAPRRSSSARKKRSAKPK
jgi:hypothetical protein